MQVSFVVNCAIFSRWFVRNFHRIIAVFKSVVAATLVDFLVLSYCCYFVPMLEVTWRSYVQSFC
jgi:hypothetical protein